ncbi:hypothetical protein ACOSP7_030434 [Xanthoceras sorbifolium]
MQVILIVVQDSIPFSIGIASDEDELPAGVSSKISCFSIGPFQASHNENTRVKVNVKLNIHGIVTVESAMLIRSCGRFSHEGQHSARNGKSGV